jgi:hypothetical protein
VPRGAHAGGLPAASIPPQMHHQNAQHQVRCLQAQRLRVSSCLLLE